MQLLKHINAYNIELTALYILTRPVFLLEKNELYLKKSNKADLSKILLGQLLKSDIITDEEDRCPHVTSDALVVDFMEIVRRLTSVDLKWVSSFGSLCSFVLKVILSYGLMEQRVMLSILSLKTTRTSALKLLSVLGEVTDMQKARSVM